MFSYRYAEGSNPNVYSVVTHDDCELFRKMDWQDGSDISKYVISVHNPDSVSNAEFNRFLNGIDSKFYIDKDTFETVHYKFIFSSAGDTRKTRAFFATQEVHDKIMPYIMNGLTMDDINTPINGKYCCSGLRFTTYESLWLTGSKRIENFDIDRCIVIKDLENELHYQALEVDAPNDTVSDGLCDVSHVAEITDGAGMYLPGVFQHTNKRGVTKDITAFTARAPWFKGLMVQHDFMAAARRANNYIIRDAWGQDHNIMLEGINCIWTTSQLKLWKAYKSWDHYKRAFKDLQQYFCMALTPEDKNKLILSYQPLQDLRATEDQVRALLKNQFDTLWKASGRRDSRTEGCEKLYNYELTLKSIGLDRLPIFKINAMLNCQWVKAKVRSYLRNEFKKMTYGKIKVKGYEPFVSPDWNWVCNKLFGDTAPEVPTGSVCCNKLAEGQEVDLVRYPHLYTGGHCLRTNVRVAGLDAEVVYVDANGITALLAEADFDGDHLQIFTDEAFLDIIKSEVNNQPPIHYVCSGGQKYPVVFDYSEHGVFQELRNSYGDSANVGVPSNLATKVFNNSKYSWDEKYRLVRLLAHMIQGCIDFPKTGVGYRLKDDIIKDIRSITKPWFMKAAKEVEDKGRLSSLNRREMVAITREMYGEDKYPEQLTREEYIEMLKEYKQQRTTYEESINYDEMPIRQYNDDGTEIKERYIMDWIVILCKEEEAAMDIRNWYAPFGKFNMGKRGIENIDSDIIDIDDDIEFAIEQLDKADGGEFDIEYDGSLPEGFVEFIKSYDDKFTHPVYATRINSQTMFNPDPTIQAEARAAYKEKFKLPLASFRRSCLFKKVLSHPEGTGFAFCQYVWPDKLLEYASNLPIKPAESVSKKQSNGGKNCEVSIKQSNGRLGGKAGGDAVAVPVIVITNDGRQFEYDNKQACANALDLKRQNINKYVDDGKYHKVKSLDCKCKFMRKEDADE